VFAIIQLVVRQSVFLTVRITMRVTAIRENIFCNGAQQNLQKMMSFDCWLTDPSTFHTTFHLECVYYLLTFVFKFVIVPSNRGLKEAVVSCSCFKTRCGHIANILIM